MGTTSSKNKPQQAAGEVVGKGGGKSEDVQVKEVQNVGSEPPPKSEDSGGKAKVNGQVGVASTSPRP
jgi:hypothetical protein